MIKIKILKSKTKNLWYYPLIGQTVDANWIRDENTKGYITQGVHIGDAQITSPGLTETQLDLIEKHLNDFDEDERNDFEGYINNLDFEIVK